MNRSFRFLLLVALMCLTTILFAQEQNQKKTTNETTVNGELVDLKCYLTSMYKAKGEGHKECAVECIKGGLPAGIVEDSTKELYLVLPKAGMDGHNEELAQFAGENVMLTGSIIKRGNQNVFLYSKIQSSK